MTDSTSSPSPAPAGASQAHARAQDNSLRQLSPLLVWAVVFCDIGTSIYYVPGILYEIVGDAAPLFVAVGLVGFVLLARKYVEICWRHPQGGGVVNVASHAFNPRLGLIGGLLILVSYFVTSAISSLSGLRYLGSLFPFVDAHAMTLTVLALALLAVLNVVGIRESARLSLIMGAAALVVNLVLIAITLIGVGPSEWGRMFDQVFSGGALRASGASGEPGGGYAKTILMGFSSAWLAFSGLESISQLSPAMKLPLRDTANKGMWIVIGSILLTSPILTLFSVEILPELTKQDHLNQQRFISELALFCGGLPIQIAVVATAASLLLFAANTAIIGGYHVFLALADEHFMPDAITWRNRRFGTPHFAIVIATFVPMFVLVSTRGNLLLLGELYAFGLLGAFVLSSLGLDVVRWREGDRTLRFWLGVLTTVLVAVAWFTSLFANPTATIAGGILVALGLAFAIGTQQKWFTDWLYDTPLVKRRARAAIAESEMDLEEGEREILSLAQAEAVSKLYPSHTLVCMRTRNDTLLQEALVREKGLGGSTVYALYIEERTGLFVRASDVDSPENSGALLPLLEAARHSERQGMTLMPIWTVSYNAVEGIVRAAEALGVDAVMVGATQRNAVYHMIRGHVVNGLAKRLPAHIRLVLCG
jgi:amino acid transporter